MMCILMILFWAFAVLISVAYILGAVLIMAAVLNFIDFLCEKVRKLRK